MKTTTAIKMVMGVFVVSLALNALAADAVISDVVVRQRWPWSRLVDIDYVLKCDSTQAMDVAISIYNGTEPLDVLASSFSGDLYGVSWGAHRIVWDPTMTAYTNNGVIPEFCVKLTTVPVPLYMIVDLTKSAGETNQVKYIYESDLASGAYGTVETNPVESVNSIVWTGVTNDTYKTDKLVLRRISKGEFKMGGALSTTLTKDFYACVFQVTQQQWLNIMGGTNPSHRKNLFSPVERVSYEDIRGSADQGLGYEWPTNDNVYAESFIGRLRTKTVLAGFDLPTDAQWEYACKAGTTSYFNDGFSISNADTNILNQLGWWKLNSEGTTHPVGQKKPSAWGLYDMHGNVWEWCLDWHASSLAGGDDPKGPKSGSSRVRRGGSRDHQPDACSSESRIPVEPAAQYPTLGFRFVRTLP